MKLKWNKEYIPVVPFTTQLSFLLVPQLEAFFGGSAGGGKSEVLLMGASQYLDCPGYAALILRRTLTELKQPSALLDRASSWFANTSARYSAEDHTWVFPARWPDGTLGPPAKIQFGYLGEFRAEERYQGAEYQYFALDEASHFENDGAYRYLYSRLRKKVCPIHKLRKETKLDEEGKPKTITVPNYVEGCMYCDTYKSIPLRGRVASNPGGPGHLWLKQRFKITKEIYTDESGTARIRWIGKDPLRPFIPSRIEDNEYIDQEGYRTSLQNLDHIRKEQLEHGDWDISPDSRFNARYARFYKAKGDYFQADSNVYHIDDLLEIFITVDPAASRDKGPVDALTNPKRGPSFTVISVWGLTADYKLLWLHMKRFREEIPYVISQIKASWKDFAKHSNSPVKTFVETNGIGAGPAQILTSQGVPIYDLRKSKDKVQNASSAIYRMKKGRIYFPMEASWLNTAMDEIFTWTGQDGMPDDIVDTLSDACNYVTSIGSGVDPLLLPDDNMMDFDSIADSPIVIQQQPHIFGV
jgi:predicted phage terminase large subunit-like protein